MDSNKIANTQKKKSDNLYRVILSVSLPFLLWLMAIRWLAGFGEDPYAYALEGSHTEHILIDKQSLIQFNETVDCPYNLFSGHFNIHFNLDSKTNVSIQFFFFEEIHDETYITLISSCYAIRRESCILAVPTRIQTKYLVAQTEKIKDATDASKGKFNWKCEIKYNTFLLGIPTLLAVFMILITLFVFSYGLNELFG